MHVITADISSLFILNKCEDFDLPFCIEVGNHYLDSVLVHTVDMMTRLLDMEIRGSSEIWAFPVACHSGPSR